MISPLDFFYTLVVFPVEVIIESVFYFVRSFFPMLGVAVAVLGVSLAVNFLALPIYNMADAQQLRERETKKKLAYWVSRIRKTFSGDERYMMLSYYYRINHYHPAMALRETASILVQVPFFIAAYHFLSNCAELKGAAFWVIKDLGVPDGLLVLGEKRLNLLPLLMTAVNLASGFIYTKNAPIREKLQSPILALVFLFLLYSSPSGLVFYWTLNNLFSLVKNAVKAYCPKPWLAVELFVCLACAYAAYFVNIRMRLYSKMLLLLFICIALALPLGRIAVLRLLGSKTLSGNGRDWRGLFAFSCLSMALLVGLVLPASMISTSPTEFAFLGDTKSPLSYIASSLTFALGLFVLWPVGIYSMEPRKYRPLLSLVMFLMALSCFLNVWVFKHNYGNVFVTGEIEGWSKLHNYRLSYLVGPPVLVMAAGLVFFFLARKGKVSWVQRIAASSCVALLIYGAVKITGIASTYKAFSRERSVLYEGDVEEGLPLEPIFHLSKTGKNVFRIFLDRGVAVYIPYIMQQFPELLESFRGFTLYPNTVSFSTFTVEGTPGLFGGYEYRPELMNKREKELLNDKSNEAQLVLPKILGSDGWACTVADPVWTSYGNIMDKEFLADCPNARQIFTEGRYSSRYLVEHQLVDEGFDRLVKRGIVKFFLLQVLYPPARYYFYSMGRSYTNTSVAPTFIDDYSTLYYLPGLTDTDAEGNTYTVISSNAAHDVVPLVEPDYHPGEISPDMLEKENVHTVYPYQSYIDLIHFECSAAAFLQLGKWLDHLREKGVYDNTRIIIMGDHGLYTGHPVFAEGFSENPDYIAFHTLLMEKDFESNGEFKCDESFMTNADAAWMALDGLGVSMVNPYTGKQIAEEKTLKDGGVNLFVCLNNNPTSHIGSTQFPIDINRAYHVSDDIYKESNWIPLADWLKEHPEDTPAGIINGGTK